MIAALQRLRGFDRVPDRGPDGAASTCGDTTLRGTSPLPLAWMFRFAVRLVRPYWKWLLFVIDATLVETAVGLAVPWPLEIVLDSVFDAKPMPAAFTWRASS